METRRLRLSLPFRQSWKNQDGICHNKRNKFEMKWLWVRENSEEKDYEKNGVSTGKWTEIWLIHKGQSLQNKERNADSRKKWKILDFVPMQKTDVISEG